MSYKNIFNRPLLEKSTSDVGKCTAPLLKLPLQLYITRNKQYHTNNQEYNVFSFKKEKRI